MPPPRRILVTGGGGFVGRHLCAALAAAYPEAAVLTPSVDVRDPAAVASMVRSTIPEVCIHLAAVSTIAAAQSGETEAWQVNLHGSLHLARAILHYAPRCQMLFASSADAYGGSVGSPLAIVEDAALAPTNVYAATKAAADLALGSMANEGLRVVRLRPFNHTGPGQSADFVVPAFARQISRIAAHLQAPLLKVGNLDTYRDFLDVRDVCAAYVASIDRRDALAPGTILNVGSGQARRIGDVLDALMAMAGVAVEVHSDPSRARANDIEFAYADIERARSLIEWQPTIPWSDTLGDVLADWQRRVAINSGEA